MPFDLRVNHKTYTVSDHAARRMIQRYIPEEMVIETLCDGLLIEQQGHGADVYQHEIYDAVLEQMVIIRVIVDEKTRRIISVIDNTEKE